MVVVTSRLGSSPRGRTTDHHKTQLSHREELMSVQGAILLAVAARGLGRTYQAHIEREDTELGLLMGRMESLISETLLPFIASSHFSLLMTSLNKKKLFYKWPEIGRCVPTVSTWSRSCCPGWSSSSSCLRSSCSRPRGSLWPACASEAAAQPLLATSTSLA